MHTPGPWKTRQGQSVCNHKGVSVAWCPTSAIVGQDFSYRVSEDEACDNARLIAKAPDLRDALQNLLTAIHHQENNPGFASAGNYVRALERARALLED